ncbi:MAG TPA: hypothetical protein VGK93_02910 [Candidatus Eisenbacteria bacterium]|jgi:GNAT superfamily N-acetyltransferase
MLEQEKDATAALERAEVEACRSYTSAASPAVAAELGLAHRPIGSALAVAAAEVDILAYNRVLALGVETPATEAELEEAVEFFRAMGVPRCMAHVAPGALPARLEAWLGARGFVRHNHWLKLCRDLSDLPREPATPRTARTGAEHAEAFARTEVEAFGHAERLTPWIAGTVGRPGWHHFATFDGADPIGFGALFVSGRAAWLGFASTRASHRRRGVQSALIAARLRAAAALSCELAVVETADDMPEKPNPSTHNLMRMGFRIAYRRPNWVLKFA